MCGVWESSWPGEEGPAASRNSVGAGEFPWASFFKNMLSKS